MAFHHGSRSFLQAIPAVEPLLPWVFAYLRPFLATSSACLAAGAVSAPKVDVEAAGSTKS